MNTENQQQQAGTAAYDEIPLSPSNEEAARKKLGLPAKYVELLHVAGMLWKLKTQVREIEEANGTAPRALDVLTWAERELRKIEGISPSPKSSR